MHHSRNDPNEYCKEQEEKENDFNFHKEKKYLAKVYGVREGLIEIDCFHPCGELCIFIEGRWCGYVDEDFTEAMRLGMSPIEYNDYLDEIYTQADYSRLNSRENVK